MKIKIEKECAVCNGKFQVSEHKANQKCCSLFCAKKILGSYARKKRSDNFNNSHYRYY